MRLKDIMSTKVESVRPGDTLEHARALMDMRGIHHLVVVERGQVFGILTAAGLEARAAEGVARVADAMTRQFVTATPETTVRDAANIMRARPEGALAVMAGHRVAGIVTVADLLDVLGRGVDRPVSRPRATLRDRGVKPRATLVGPRHR